MNSDMIKGIWIQAPRIIMGREKNVGYNVLSEDRSLSLGLTHLIDGNTL